MSKRKAPLDEKALEFFRRTGRQGGKRRLIAMTAEERSAIAKKASLAAAKKRQADAKRKKAKPGSG